MGGRGREGEGDEGKAGRGVCICISVENESNLMLGMKETKDKENYACERNAPTVLCCFCFSLGTRQKYVCDGGNTVEQSDAHTYNGHKCVCVSD